MKDKIMNFLIVFFLTLITINLFFNKKEDLKSLEGIIVNVSNSFTIPAGVKLNISNYDEDKFTFNTCGNLIIRKDSTQIKMDNCEDITINSQESYLLDLSKEYSKFMETGEYFVELEKEEIKITKHFEVQNRGIIGKIFIFFFYAPIYNLMAFLLELSNYSLGWAIVIITIIIRLLLLFPQHKMMINQAKMQKIQPKIKEIQEKHKGNHQTIGMELMNLYKKENVSPMGSCGLLLIQMPILLVIYRVIAGIQNISNTYYLYDFLGDYDMSKIVSKFYFVDLFDVGGINGLVLAIIIGVLQFIQMKLSMFFQKQKNPQKKGVVLEKKKNANSYSDFMPDPEMLNKFMLYGMPIMIGFASYKFFAGVGLYWGIGTIFMILQQLVVNKILKK